MVRRSVLAIAIAWVITTIGCGSPPVGELPPLHPAKGTVVRAGKPLADCILRFLPAKDDPNLTISAATDAEGRFEAATQTALGNVRKPGVPEGTYRVTIDLPMGSDQTGGGAVELAGQVVKAGENTFQFDVATAAKK